MKNFKPHSYQQEAIHFLESAATAYRPPGKPAGAGLWLDPGLGKTAITLSALETLIAVGEVARVLVIAPKRVCQSVWPAEIEKWGSNLTTSLVLGTERQRKLALATDADLYLTNPENVTWLAKCKSEGTVSRSFDSLVVDESTKFKSSTSKRWKSLKRMLSDFSVRITLTGTPAPNSLMDTWSQVMILDNGEALGQSVSRFRSRYCYKGGFRGRQWIFDEGNESELYEAIGPLVLRMKAEDYLSLPRLVKNEVWVDLPSDILTEYKRLERDLFMELAGGADITASSAGAMYTMCKGVANGGVYDGTGRDRVAMHVHDTKVDAAAEIVDELNGKGVMIAYQFHHDLERLRKRWPGAPAINGQSKDHEVDAAIRDWNDKKIPVLLVQPQAMAHGLNMQKGGHDIIWFGVSDRLEDYEQLNRRIYRQGVDGDYVRLHHILARNTVDEAIWGRINDKADRQANLMAALQRYREGR